MLKLKHSLLALVSVAALCGATSASADQFEIYDGTNWIKNGVVSFLGPTSATYLGNTVPCDANFTVTLTNGVGAVTGAAFTGSSTCNGITVSASPSNPWPMTPSHYTGPNPPFTGAPTLTTTIWGVAISNVRIYLPPPLNVYCPSSTGTASINGALDSTWPSNMFVFKGALGACAVQTRAGGALRSTVPVRVVP
ncbi:hypothetical protein ABIE09_004535 [Lysobacter enzymogenes]|uniref:Protein activator of alkane oxidation PraB n=1 Tax=Lysobacter enzymogenes TaxID=69 RepID=A0AAU9AL29_LYSEN|nr:hypothetical protein [Lysobacter enzymogenes]BAV99817.1 hypothetical protein LEN_4330 [Lysobacter enzymogenes]